MIFRNLTHLRGCRSNSTEAMPLIDFDTVVSQTARCDNTSLQRLVFQSWLFFMSLGTRGKEHTDLKYLGSCGAEIDDDCARPWSKALISKF